MATEKVCGPLLLGAWDRTGQTVETSRLVESRANTPRLRRPGALGIAQRPLTGMDWLRLFVNGAEEPLCELAQLGGGRLGLLLQPPVVLAQVPHLRLQHGLVLLLLWERERVTPLLPHVRALRSCSTRVLPLAFHSVTCFLRGDGV